MIQKDVSQGKMKSHDRVLKAWTQHHLCQYPHDPDCWSRAPSVDSPSVLMAKLSKSPLIFFQLVMQATRDHAITGVIEACLLFRFDPLPLVSFTKRKYFEMPSSCLEHWLYLGYSNLPEFIHSFFWRSALMSEHWGVFLVDFLYIVQDYLQSERIQRAVSVFFFWVTVDCEHARGAGGEGRETTGGTHTLYKPAHYATSRKQHCWLTTPNIVGCYIHVAFVSTPCCMLLRVVAKSLKPATTCKRTQQHPTMLGVVGQQCCLRLQGL